jgi:hypothetical protein
MHSLTPRRPVKSMKFMTALGYPALALLAWLALGCMPMAEKSEESAISPQQTYSYSRDIRPILETKCISCHACNDAPCQFKLTSAPGLLRGATRSQVYDSARLDNAPPTRLFVDAQTPAEWREKGFYSVFNVRGGPLSKNLEHSLLYDMIALGKAHPLPANTPVPEDIELGLGRKNECPLPGDFEKYRREKPWQGMPLAITGLSDSEYETLEKWVLEGGVIDERPAVPGPKEQAWVRDWEAFFNQPTPKNQLVSRYLYEHLFAAHLYDEDIDTENFFELVRSKTPPGEPIRDIATVRPNDDPGGPFHYRLRRVEGTIVGKSHLPYALGRAKRARFEELFLTPEWNLAALPDYARLNAANPFVPFSAIPARARYQFMLDTAEYFVMTFIRGPVCAGQVATDVIEDRFFVLFQSPDADLSVSDPAYLKKVEPHLELVPQEERLIALETNWRERKDARNEYIRLRGQAYRDMQAAGASLDDVWDGDGTNDNAALTVFRNFDNAMVTKGFVGAVPKTIWVMDYPLLERTYYLLVVNFDVFGSLATQVETRFYFDLIRSGGENNFLDYMPPEARTAMRDSWYRGSDAELKVTKTYEVVNEDMPVQIPYRTSDPKQEFVSLVSDRLGPLVGPPDVLNGCPKPPCALPGAGPAQRAVEQNLQTLTSKPASDDAMGFIDFMPDLAFLRVRTGKPEEDLAYTLIRDKSHTNVAFMFGEAKRRETAKDSLTIYRGLIGNYPNFMFDVPIGEIESFTDALHGAHTVEQFTALVGRYGISRTHPEIWTDFQWFVDFARRVDPIDAGVYDLNRYKKVADLMADEKKK